MRRELGLSRCARCCCVCCVVRVKPVKSKGAVKAKEKKVVKVVDPSQFHHNNWRGNDIFQLVRALPKPKLAGFEYERHKRTRRAARGGTKQAEPRSRRTAVETSLHPRV